ncbi:MAG: sugar phosphate isomerase/epimerase [Acidobacteria bacterium]|nr:sugar phosphate isomerase/epimerase [Acidobacteriota bacterium]
MKLGIASWTVPWAIGMPGYPMPANPLSPVGLLDLAVRHGVSIVQIADNMPLHEKSDAELSELSREAAARGIELEGGTRGIEPSHLMRYLDVCRAIGARKLRTLLHTATVKPTIEQAAAWMREVLPAFEAAGVAIALENNEAHTVREYSWLVTELASPSLGICMDTANSLGRPETLDRVVEGLAPHTIILHVKDYSIRRVDTRMGFDVIGTAAGEGKVDFPRVFEALRKHNRSPSVILEHWPPFSETIERTVKQEEEWVERSLKFLRPWVNGAS